MRYAVNLPIIGEYSSPKALVELAKDSRSHPHRTSACISPALL